MTDFGNWCLENEVSLTYRYENWTYAVVRLLVYVEFKICSWSVFNIEDLVEMLPVAQLNLRTAELKKEVIISEPTSNTNVLVAP